MYYLFLSPTKRAKTKNIHYSPILQVCMKTHSGMAEFKNFRVILDSGKISAIVMGKLILKLKPKETAKTMWKNQAGKFTTSKKVNVDFCLSEFSTTEIVTWKCHVDESTNGRYDMILGRDLLTTLRPDLKFSENTIIGR